MEFSKNVILHIPPIPSDWTKDKKLNKRVVETAGFVPLEVKFKQFEQAGIRAQFYASDFDSSDYREIFFGENNQIYPGDDLEVVNEKLARQELTRQAILKSKTSPASPAEVAKAKAAAASTNDVVEADSNKVDE